MQPSHKYIMDKRYILINRLNMLPPCYDPSDMQPHGITNTLWRASGGSAVQGLEDLLYDEGKRNIWEPLAVPRRRERDERRAGWSHYALVAFGRTY